jgi:hypothetical protein
LDPQRGSICSAPGALSTIRSYEGQTLPQIPKHEWRLASPRICASCSQANNAAFAARLHTVASMHKRGLDALVDLAQADHTRAAADDAAD